MASLLAVFVNPARELGPLSDPQYSRPLTALAPELARGDEAMKDQFFAELVNYGDRMVSFMPGRRTADKQRAFFLVFSTMIGAMQIARILHDRAVQEKVLTNARDFLLQSLD